MIKEIKANGKGSYTDFKLMIANRNIGVPEKEIIKEKIPHMNGSYDFSKLNGELTYDERTISYTFNFANFNIAELQEEKSNFLNWVMNIFDEDIYDPYYEDYHFHGSYDSCNWSEEFQSATLEVNFKVYPYLIKNKETKINVLPSTKSKDGATILLDNTNNVLTLQSLKIESTKEIIDSVSITNSNGTTEKVVTYALGNEFMANYEDTKDYIENGVLYKNVGKSGGSYYKLETPYTTPIKSYDLKGNKIESIDNIKDTIDGTTLHNKISSFIIDTSKILIASGYTKIVYAEVPKPTDSKSYGNYDNNKVLCTNKVYSSLDADITPWDDPTRAGYIYSIPISTSFWIGYPVGTTLNQIKADLQGSVITYELLNEKQIQVEESVFELLDGQNTITNDKETNIKIDYSIHGVSSIVINNKSSHRIVPTIISDSNMTIKIHNSSYSVGIGTFKDSKIYFDIGKNDVEVLGNGNISFEYNEEIF